MKCIKCCVLFFFINCSIFKISCMDFFNNEGFGNMGQMINNICQMFGDAELGDVVEEVKKVLNGFKLEGEDDAAKLLKLKDNIGDFILILQNLLGDKANDNILVEIIKECIGNINQEDLKNADSSAKIKKVLASSILFSGENNGDCTVDINKEAKDINEEGKLIFLFHGMGDNSENFCDNIKNNINGFSIVSVEYNGCSLSSLDKFIEGLYKVYEGTIKNFHNIYILGYSFGCLIANKFRSKLLEMFQEEEEFKDKDMKVHFIFYKGFYNLLRCPAYTGAVSILKMINELYEKVYVNGGFVFLKDTASDNELAEFTSNYNLLKESRQDTQFCISYVHTPHNRFGANNIEIQGALQKIEKNILGNPNMNHVLFVSSDNDNMVSDGGRMLFDGLTRPQGSAVEKRSEQSPDCCY